MRKLAIDLGIAVVWFYGEPGHGRGLVDAMSSFDCKLQLRHEILTNDSWFETAEGMVVFLKKYFENDSSKEHTLLDAAEIAKVRQEERGEFKLEPCRVFHVIAFNNDGCFAKVLFFRDTNIISNIFNSDAKNNESSDVDDDDEDEIHEEFRLNHDTVFELIEPGTYIGMRSPTNAIETFFIAEVIQKGIAENNIYDTNGHHILSGERYAEVRYLQRYEQKRKFVKYQRPKKEQFILIHVAEVFVTNVALDEDLCMDIRVYSWKCGADGCYHQMWQVSCRRQGMLTQGPAPDPKSKV